ncbi:MAG: hypothetical protein M9895_10295 [Aquamicrobium sp.]|uniref:hypothetical protein n=1 Tax=Aquamicrobium sp. TaxID=1872579 RepID=UPI00349E7C11|nr:hypothetical protein [Aquamicrobium sp.]
MPLQNRVDPLGHIHAVAARGLFTGNRGVIHDPLAKALLTRRWTTKAWIVCALDHPRGCRREPMGRNAPSGAAGWTELFFLDEATALAAGHRPCFYCRRAAAEAFRRCFAAGNRLGHVPAPDIDSVLHRQRHAAGAALPTLDAQAIGALPDGAMIEAGGRILALHAGRARPWSFGGYGPPQALPPGARLVTPAATVAALGAGFSPVWHPTLTPA